MNSAISTDRVKSDLERDVWCLFGLPIDNLTTQSAIELIRKKTKEPGSAVLSTVNVNWIVRSFQELSFRSAILNSEIVTIDGRPLLWLSKLLGYPMKEVVAGSSLVQELLEVEDDNSPPLTIFIFGGEEGVGEKAIENINKKKGGLRAVGCLFPGFGSIEDLSEERFIKEINHAAPDILLVALGAEKGVKWIERNRHRLNAKVISHLGATINFLAGTIKRAPVVLRSLGMEWCWRIIQEPKLFHRYYTDGMFFVWLLIKKFPMWINYILRKSSNSDSKKLKIYITETSDSVILAPDPNAPDFGGESKAILAKAVVTEKDIIVDIDESAKLDGSFLGLLCLILKWQLARSNTMIFRRIGLQGERVIDFFDIKESIKATNRSM